MLKNKKIRFAASDIKVLKSYIPKKRYFIPLVGHILLWKEYNRIKSNVSSTTKRVVNSRKTFYLSMFGDILATNILCWIIILADIVLGTLTGLKINEWFVEVPRAGAISLWSINAFAHLIYIYFLFTPFIVEWKILEGLTAIDMATNKKMDAGIWLEA